MAGNQGRSAGATTRGEVAVPAGDAGGVLRARGGGKRAEKRPRDEKSLKIQFFIFALVAAAQRAEKISLVVGKNAPESALVDRSAI